MNRHRMGSMAMAFTIGLVGLLAASAQDAAKLEKALQGTWTGEHRDKKLSITFEKDNFTVKGDDNEVNGTIKLDPTKKPKTMDLAVTGGRGEQADKYTGKTARAIYEVEGDTLKWCANEPGREERPDAFPADPNEPGKHLYVIFKREKK